VEHYRTRVTLKSNDDTEMTITNDGGPQTVQVIAYNFNGITVELITESGHVYHISPEMLTSPAEKEHRLPTDSYRCTWRNRGDRT